MKLKLLKDIVLLSIAAWFFSTIGLFCISFFNKDISLSELRNIKNIFIFYNSFVFVICSGVVFYFWIKIASKKMNKFLKLLVYVSIIAFVLFFGDVFATNLAFPFGDAMEIAFYSIYLLGYLNPLYIFSIVILFVFYRRRFSKN